MRRYEDPVDVRRGPVPGYGLGEAPEQFWWRGRVWKVRAVLARWVTTGAWWESAPARAVLGTDVPAAPGEPVAYTDVLGERECWRVEAGDRRSTGVFELSYDGADGAWQLLGCAD